MTGKIFNIQRFCTQDGQGIRTTVFFKGCPLRCEWCHNPESQQKINELMYDSDKCVSCLKCVSKCPNEAQRGVDGKHGFDRNKCVGCGKCVSPICDALVLEGREISADEIIDEVMKDKLYYDNSGGGITLSGGEPLIQGEFCKELLKKAKENRLHVCIETCGYVSKEILKETAEFIDVYLFDYKETDPAKHKRLTGADNYLIIENLHFLDKMGKSIVLRCPIIPTVNDTQEHFSGIASLADSLENITEVVIEPYHSFGEGKYARLDREYSLKNISSPDDKTVDDWISTIQSRTRVKVTKE